MSHPARIASNGKEQNLSVQSTKETSKACDIFRVWTDVDGVNLRVDEALWPDDDDDDDDEQMKYFEGFGRF
jgi:hypothetical protein